MGTADQISEGQSKRERSIEKSMTTLEGVFVIGIICIAAAVLSGCSGTLEKSVSACYALDGSPSYTKAGDTEKFSCERPSSSVTTKVAR